MSILSRYLLPKSILFRSILPRFLSVIFRYLHISTSPLLSGFSNILESGAFILSYTYLLSINILNSSQFIVYPRSDLPWWGLSWIFTNFPCDVEHKNLRISYTKSLDNSTLNMAPKARQELVIP